jgi:hypothetical protein
MEIRFLTKEESNQIRKEEILAMSPSDRFLAFWKLSKRVNSLFPSSISFEERTKGNFVLERKTK